MIALGHSAGAGCEQRTDRENDEGRQKTISCSLRTCYLCSANAHRNLTGSVYLGVALSVNCIGGSITKKSFSYINTSAYLLP